MHRRLAELVVDPEERARHLALATTGPHLQVAGALEEAGRHARARGAPDAAADLLELARKLTPPEDGAGLLRRSVEAAGYHFDAGDAIRATALLEAAIAMARPGRDRAPLLLHLASISWLDLPRVQRLSEQALEEAGDDAAIRTTSLEHLAWVGIYRGDLAFAAEHAGASRRWARRITHLAIRAESLSTLAIIEFLMGRPARDLMAEAVRLEDLAMREGPGSQATVFTASRTCHGLQLLWAGELDAAREVLHQELAEYERLGRYVVRGELLTYLALAEHRRVPQPFELARTLLVRGEVERRAKQKRAARSTLEQALAIFQQLGAPLWAQRARDDLARVVGAVPPSSTELTPTEQRIAQLVGEGMKNREVADALFISVKTVEANLSRIFHKLGVRSRTELSYRLAATHRVSPDSSPPHEA